MSYSLDFILPFNIVSKPNISDGAKILYAVLKHDYPNGFGTFSSSEYKQLLSCCERTCYRHFKELLDSNCIYEERGFYKFYY